MWIESHQELRDHPKTKRAARLLGISTVALVGHLHFIWWRALEYAQDGNLAGYDPADIADWASWEGDPDQLIDALIQCRIRPDKAGFLERDVDGNLILHDWDRYAGKLIDERARRAAHARAMRAARDEREGNVTGTSATRKGLPYRTVPNRTVPNHKSESERGVEGDARGKTRKPAAAVPVPPALADFDEVLKTVPAYKPSAKFYTTVLEEFGQLNLKLEAVKITEYLPSEANTKKRKGTTGFVLNWLEIAKDRRLRTDTTGLNGASSAPAGPTLPSAREAAARWES
jgi:hypothetical protein